MRVRDQSCNLFCRNINAIGIICIDFKIMIDATWNENTHNTFEFTAVVTTSISTVLGLIDSLKSVAFIAQFKNIKTCTVKSSPDLNHRLLRRPTRQSLQAFHKKLGLHESMQKFQFANFFPSVVTTFGSHS